jgi:hypothetical protein
MRDATFMVPIPRAASFAELNARLLECCRRRLNDRLRDHAETIVERATSHTWFALSYNGRIGNNMPMQFVTTPGLNRFD